MVKPEDHVNVLAGRGYDSQKIELTKKEQWETATADLAARKKKAAERTKGRGRSKKPTEDKPSTSKKGKGKAVDDGDAQLSQPVDDPSTEIKTSASQYVDIGGYSKWMDVFDAEAAQIAVTTQVGALVTLVDFYAKRRINWIDLEETAEARLGDLVRLAVRSHYNFPNTRSKGSGPFINPIM